MAIVLATAALIVALLLGVPTICGSGWAILYVLGASGGRPQPADILFPSFLILVCLAGIVGAALHLGTLL